MKRTQFYYVWRTGDGRYWNSTIGVVLKSTDATHFYSVAEADVEKLTEVELPGKLDSSDWQLYAVETTETWELVKRVDAGEA